MAKVTYIRNENDAFERSPVNSRKPTREPNVHSDVHVPMQSGFAVASFVFVIILALSVYINHAIPSIENIALAFIFSMVIGLGIFIWRMEWASKVIWAIETVVPFDINHDGYRGEPSHPVRITRNGQGRANPSVQHQNRFEEFVHTMYEKGTNHHALRDQFKDTEIARFRQYMVDIGLAKWKSEKSHNSGLDLIVDEFTAEDILSKTPWVETAKPQRATK